MLTSDKSLRCSGTEKMTENDLILYKTSIMDEEMRFMYVRKLVQTSLTFFENYNYLPFVDWF